MNLTIKKWHKHPNNESVDFTVGFGEIEGVYALVYPTGNCQLGSLFNFQQVIGYCNGDVAQVKKLLPDLKKALCYKPLCLFDVRKNYEAKMDAIFEKESIVMKSEYKSTNGSEMIIYIIKTQTW